MISLPTQIGDLLVAGALELGGYSIAPAPMMAPDPSSGAAPSARCRWCRLVSGWWRAKSSAVSLPAGPAHDVS